MLKIEVNNFEMVVIVYSYSPDPRFPDQYAHTKKSQRDLQGFLVIHEAVQGVQSKKADARNQKNFLKCAGKVAAVPYANTTDLIQPRF